MNDNQWEDLFRQTLYHYQAEPPQHAFAAIIKRCRRPKVKIWVWFTILCLLFGTNIQQAEKQQAYFVHKKTTQRTKYYQKESLSNKKIINTTEKQVFVNKQISKNWVATSFQTEQYFERKNSQKQDRYVPKTDFSKKQAIKNQKLEKDNASENYLAAANQTEQATIMANSSTQEQAELSDNLAGSTLKFDLKPFEIELIESVKKRRYLAKYREKAIRLMPSFAQGAAVLLAGEQQTHSQIYSFDFEPSKFTSFGLKVERQLSRRWSVGLGWSKTNWAWRQTIHSKDLHPRYETIWNGSTYTVKPIFAESTRTHASTLSLSNWEAGARYLVGSKRRLNYSLTASLKYWTAKTENSIQNGWALQAGWDWSYAITRRLSATAGVLGCYYPKTTMPELPLQVPSAFLGIQVGTSWQLR